MIKRIVGTNVGAILLRGASVFLVISAAGTGITFLLHVLLARVLGADSYGNFAYTINVMAILLMVGQLGYQHASVRFVSQYKSEADLPRLRGFYRLSTLDVLVAVSAISIMTTLVIELANRTIEIERELAESLRLLALLVPIMSFSAVWSGRLRGLKAVSESQVPTTIVQPICFGLCVLALNFSSGEHVGAPEALASYALAALASFALSAIFLRRRTAAGFQETPLVYERGKWRRVAASFLAVTSVQIVRHRSLILIIGFYQAAAEIGFFYSATRVASLSIFGLTAVAAWASPMISEYHALGRHDRLQQLARVAARYTTAISVPVTIVIVVFGREILALFGPEFKAVYVPLIIMALGQLVNSVTGPVGYLLTMTGNHSAAVRIEMATALVAVTMSLLLVPTHGLTGAALADACANVVRNVGLFIAVWHRLGIRSALI